MAQAIKGEYTLSLTYEEAKSLLMVCHSVGGHPETTRRGYIDNIRKALVSMGFPDIDDYPTYDGSRFEFEEGCLFGSVTFFESISCIGD